jgi:hypothetical protein
VSLPPGKTPFAVKVNNNINNNNKKFLELTILIFISELVLHRPYYFSSRLFNDAVKVETT